MAHIMLIVKPTVLSLLPDQLNCRSYAFMHYTKQRIWKYLADGSVAYGNMV